MDMYQRTHELRTLSALLLGACLGSACVDPKGRYDDFNERTASMRSRDSGMGESTSRFDWSGSYLLALSTVLAADSPLLFVVDAEVASDLTSAALRVQPLTTNMDSEPRTPVGEAFTVKDVTYSEDGTFEADLGEVAVPGRANPITGSDIVAQVQLRASAHEAGDIPQHFCGEATGMVSQPISLDLTGSTFGAVLTDDVKAAEPMLRCP
jgi:hypothetical protein